MSVLHETVGAVRPADHEAVERAWRRQHALTKPRGALGGLEELGARFAGSAGACPPPLPTPVAVAALLAVPLEQAVARVLSEVSTFDAAGITDEEGAP